MVWCSTSWFPLSFADDNQPTFFKRLCLDVWLFLIIRFSLKILFFDLFRILHFFLVEWQHVLDDLKPIIYSISCQLHQYKQNQFAHQVGCDPVNHQTPVSHWHYWLWAELQVFAVFQHLLYLCEVYAIVIDIQTDVFYVFIHLLLKTSSQ